MNKFGLGGFKSVEGKTSDSFLDVVLLLLCWVRYIVTFAEVLTMYQIHHP
jgi:hypothetical protein